MNEHNTSPNQAISGFMKNRVYDMSYYMHFLQIG